MSKNKSTQIKCSAGQVRVPIFAPVRRLKRNDKNVSTVSTSWGKATITGELTQRHRDFLDIIFYSDEVEIHKMEDGGAACLINAYKMARLMGVARPGKNDVTWLRNIIEDLRVAQLKIEIDTGSYYTRSFTGIVSRHSYTENTDDQDRVLYAVALTPEFVALCDHGPSLHWRSDELVTLVKLPATAAAVARFMRSHRPGTRYKIDTVLESIGINRDKMSARCYRKRIEQLKNSLDDIRRLGIDIANDRVIRLDIRRGGPSIPTRRTLHPDKADPPSRRTDP